MATIDHEIMHAINDQNVTNYYQGYANAKKITPNLKESDYFSKQYSMTKRAVSANVMANESSKAIGANKNYIYTYGWDEHF